MTFNFLARLALYQAARESDLVVLLAPRWPVTELAEQLVLALVRLLAAHSAELVVVVPAHQLVAVVADFDHPFSTFTSLSKINFRLSNYSIH